MCSIDGFSLLFIWSQIFLALACRHSLGYNGCHSHGGKWLPYSSANANNAPWIMLKSRVAGMLLVKETENVTFIVLSLHHHWDWGPQVASTPEHSLKMRQDYKSRIS